MKSRVKWNSCKVKQEFHNFLYISSVNLTSVEYYNPNKYLWAFRFWATLLFKYFCTSIIYCYKFKVAWNEIWKGKKLNWVIYYKNLANYEASHAKMSSSIKSIRLTYMSNMKSGKISIPWNWQGQLQTFKCIFTFFEGTAI